MNKIRLTKQFAFEMAHALLDYDGLCKNIHGHSYVLWVTVKGTPVTDEKNCKNGMVIDFSVLNNIIKQQIISVFDHALILNSRTDKMCIDNLTDNFENIVLVDYQPTCENLLFDFVKRINPFLDKCISLHSIKLQETASSYAEWHAEDNI